MEIIDLYKPDFVSIEELFFNNNAKTAIAVGQARGVIILAAVNKGVPVREGYKFTGWTLNGEVVTEISMNQKGAVTLALVNVEYSALAKSADISVPIKAGVEVAVASTKAYVCQLAVFYILSSYLANKLQEKSIDYINQLY